MLSILNILSRLIIGNYFIIRVHNTLKDKYHKNIVKVGLLSNTLIGLVLLHSGNILQYY